jgi:hypothetical protein
MAGDIGAIFRRHGPAYDKRFGERMLPSHRKAMQDLGDCRTGQLGGHLCQCPECHSRHYRYHSCKSRFCPKCQWKNTNAWIEAHRKTLMPVVYFHLVFTLPRELRPIVRSNQKAMLAVLFKAAVSSLMDLAMDPHYVGGRIGVLAVLHTWTRAMLYHPHLHCIVPAGGLDPEKDHWAPSRDKYLVPVRALSSLFRTRFMTLAKKRLPEIEFPKSVWDKNWVVYAKPAVQGAERVLDYLGRYVHRVAITNARILDSTEDRIRIRYLDRRKSQHRCASLQPDEFIRRFLQHVLPRGFHKVRSYGLLSPRYRAKLKQLQQEFGEPEVDEKRSLDADIPQPFIPPNFGICPACKKGLLKPLYWVPPRKRAPPQWA